MSGPAPRNKRDENSEVEEILRAAEDEALLNLSVGSHSARSNLLDSDIARRFEALKMPSSSSYVAKAPLAPKNESIEASVSSLDVDDNLKTILGADLSARFAALKKAPSSSSSSSSTKEFQGHPQKFHDYHDEDDDDDDDIDGEGVSKKEVDKVIQWAIDAARLDPSVSSDDDYVSDSDEEEEEEEEEKEKKKKEEGSKKKKDQN